ncbi:hypothetical protein C4D60_Mb04t06990 [Musa balbisiana]|uniref:Uncharacterized protein n=1 Tax=Musa balbisiana TaxID=52838 RepID=A0A4S8KA79_MUSBA|nr:hypothetical protein C4D60_Mb04t06990 [Musa balbisiana]
MSDFGSSAATVAAEFDSDEWMESLIGESPAESSVLMSEPWPSATECAGALFVDAFPSCSADISLPSALPAASDLNRVFFSEPSKIPPLALVQHHQAAAVVASNPPAAQVPACDRPEPEKNCGAAAVRKQARERSISSPPLLESLLQCARLADSDPHLATKSLIHVRESASELGDPTERVAFYFAEALHRRLLGAQRKHPLPTSAPQPPPLDSSPEEFTLCYKVLNDACPYFKFAQLTANQAIIEATESAGRIHIVDFGIVQGVQWPSLLQALATRPSGKPSKVRISGIPAPALGGAALATSLAATGNRLRDFAALLDLDFEFDCILTPIPEIAASTFRVDPDELVVVNFVLQLSQLLGDSPEPVERVLRVAKSLGPRIVTLAEYEASLNHAGFVDRFGAALGHYAAVFESLDPAMGRDAAERARMERVLIGHRILEAVGPFEEQNRRVRMAPKEEWRAVMERCGFSSVPLSNYAVSQAKLLLWNYNYSSRYTLLDSPPPCLTLAWGDRPLLTVSSWR